MRDGRARHAKPRILLVEDDLKLAALVKEYLESDQFEVNVESRGDTAANRILTDKHDLVILDVMLPGLDGFEVCKRVRPDFDGPILMLTARSEEVDEVIGLETGADDYMSKPVRPRLLLARMRTLLRRVQLNETPRTISEECALIELTNLQIDATQRSVLLKGHPIYLTTAEFDLLWFLAQRPGEVVTRDQIFEKVIGMPYDGLDRSADLRITRLRKKLGDDGKQPSRIKSIRSVGYLLAP
ncbi:MAG: response regulator [Verrucomicrobiales bacterium]|nr:response regulator [Verrucomicrobiales bacterium]